MLISYFFLIPVLCSASWSDWKKRIIPNTLLFPSFVLALIIHYSFMGFKGLIFSLTGAAIGFALLIIPFLLGGMGAGDVKLLMVVGSFVGKELVLYGFIVGAIIGGLISIFLYLYRRVVGIKIESIPYGIPLSLGTMSCILMEYLR